MDLIQCREGLTAGQEKLIEEIEDKFDTENDKADIGILYEVTGYKYETSSEHQEFWNDFADIERSDED